MNNSESLTIFELTTAEQFASAFPVMKQLRTDLTKRQYETLLEEMHRDGYKLFALTVDGKMVSLIGFNWRTNFYNKRHIFVSDLVTDESYRSLGYGETLLEYIQDWATTKGAAYVTLESGLQRSEAHRFYEEKLDYDKWCYSFRKSL